MGVINDPSFIDALEEVHLESVRSEQEYKEQESYFNTDAEELQTFLTVCSQAVSLEPKPMLQYLADYGFTFDPQCLKGDSSDKIIRNIISNCKDAALEHQRFSLTRVEEYALYHQITDREQFQELYEKEKLFAFALFDDENLHDVNYNLSEAFGSQDPKRNWNQAMKEFAVAFPEMTISVVFQAQSREQGEDELPEGESDEGDEL